MTFLQPWAVWFLAGAPVIIALYFLRHRRRSVTVSTHLFWQRALNESSRRALFRRLRNLLSLLLHLLIYALIVGALLRPSLDRSVAGTAAGQQRRVIVLDARARMQALEPDGEARFAKAVDAARAEVRRGGAGRQTALVILDSNASVAVSFTTEEKPLLDALSQVRPVDSSGDEARALALAGTLLASSGEGSEILYFSDRPAAVASMRKVVSQVVGTARDNVAITRFATRPLPASPETSEVLLEVQNFGQSPASSDVELSFDGRPLEVRPFTLAPGQKRQEIFASVPRPSRNARGWLVARLPGSDALAVDNTAYALLPPTRPARVLLVSQGNPFLEKFLGVDTTLKYQVITPEGWQPALAPKFEAVIFDNALPAGFDLSAAAGNFLFLKTTPFPAGKPLEQPLVTDVEPAHPSTRNVTLQNVAILRAAGLELPAPRDGWVFTAPLRSFENPLMIAGERKGQRMAAIAFDVMESDLPLRVAFPLLMSNTLHWLAGEQQESAMSVLAGDSLALAAGERVSADPLTSPQPGAAPAPALEGTLQPVRNGYYALAAGDSTRWIAVNTFSAAESDLRAAGGASSPGAPGLAAPALAALPPWQWLSLAALLLFSAEWWLFHRRKTE